MKNGMPSGADGTQPGLSLDELQYNKLKLLPHGYSIRPGAGPNEPAYVIQRDFDGLVLNSQQMDHDTFEKARQWLAGRHFFP